MNKEDEALAKQIVEHLLEDGPAPSEPILPVAPAAPAGGAGEAAKIVAFEFVDDGIEHEQYWAGVGLAFSKFEHVATGIGDDPAEAFEDALGMIAQQESGGVDLSAIEQSEEGQAYASAHTPSVKEVLDRNRATPEGSEEADEEASAELHYYLSIRYNLPGEEEREEVVGEEPPVNEGP